MLAAPPAQLYHSKFVAGFAVLFALAFLLQVTLYTTHGRWNTLLPFLLTVALWMTASFVAMGRHRVWWRQIAGAALNVGIAVGIGLLPVNLLVLVAARGAHLRDGIIAQIAVPTVAALLSALLAAAKVGVQRVLRELGRPSSLRRLRSGS